MKSERRHQLQQNELADVLGSFIQKGRPYAPALISAAVVLVLGILAYGIYQSMSADKQSQATLSYLIGTGEADPAALGLIGDEYAGTEAAVLARLSQADINLAQGIEALYTDRDEAIGRLEDAVAAYRGVLESNPQSPLIRSRATFGLAQALESTPGKAEEAIEVYQQVVQLDESEAIVTAAQQAINRLQRPEIKEFLAWFEEQRPQPADPSMPPELPDSALLPDMPDIQLPNVPSPDTDQPADGQPAATPPGTMELPGEEAAPTETGPATGPVTEEPAADSEPAAEPETVTEEPVTEEPVTEEPVTEEPVTEEPVTEEPVTEEPVTEEPVTEEPVTEEPADESPSGETETETASETEIETEPEAAELQGPSNEAGGSQ